MTDSSSLLKAAADAAASHADAPHADKETLSIAGMAVLRPLALPQDVAGGLSVTGGFTVTLAQGADSLWAVLRAADGHGLLLRLAEAPGGLRAVEVTGGGADTAALRLTAASPRGRHEIRLWILDDDQGVLRVMHRLHPSAAAAAAPEGLRGQRDLIAFGPEPKALRAGRVLAHQRGLNTALVLLERHTELTAAAGAGLLLYLQNLTALNRWFQVSGLRPDGAAGGAWPVMGFELPPRKTGDLGPEDHLKPEESLILSDALLLPLERPAEPDAEIAIAQAFLRGLDRANRVLGRPDSTPRNWPERARRTLRDLETAPGVQIRNRQGAMPEAVFIRPYLDAEEPDSFSHLVLLEAIRRYEAWAHGYTALSAALEAGVEAYRDPDLRVFLRYLPDAPPEKPRHEIDSWYLLHPLLSLGRLGRMGFPRMKALFLASLERVIQAAQRLDYRWPIFFDIRDFRITKAARNEAGLGETDANGLYAWIMLEAHDLTGEPRYREEARQALEAIEGLGFSLFYQANLTAWTAAATVRLWQLTGRGHDLRRVYPVLASFFHNTALWHSEMRHARGVPNWMSVMALHDSAYRAAFECHDCLIAIQEVCRRSGPGLDSSARRLLYDFWRAGLDWGWFFFPDTLPEAAIAPKPKNGRNDRALSLPLEDLYPDGQPAGQVGQEVYGAGLAPLLASLAFRPLPNRSVTVISCEAQIMDLQAEGLHAARLQLDGPGDDRARLSVWAPLPPGIAVFHQGQRLPPIGDDPEGRRDWWVPAHSALVLRWDPES